MPLIFKDFCNLYGNFSKIYITKKTKKKTDLKYEISAQV